MDRALAGSFLERQALAASARSPDGFPGAATRLILAELARREPDVFGPRGLKVSRNYARLVIHTALEAVVENEAYFRGLAPHLTMEMLRGLGVLDAKIDTVHADVTKILEIVSRMAPRFLTPATAEVELFPTASPSEVDQMKIVIGVSEQGQLIVFHNRMFPYSIDRIDYDPATRLLHFVILGNFRRDFGIPLREDLVKHVRDGLDQVLLVLVDEESGKRVGSYLPLRHLGPRPSN